MSEARKQWLKENVIALARDHKARCADRDSCGISLTALVDLLRLAKVEVSREEAIAIL